jgi:hypothetical protein
MAALKGNTYAAKPGHEKKFRVRVADEGDFPDITALDPYARGVALIGYLHWLESPESDDNDFIGWIKANTDYGQY